jgi:bifunctional non-homologous end joining protein LigD
MRKGVACSLTPIRHVEPSPSGDGFDRRPQNRAETWAVTKAGCPRPSGGKSLHVVVPFKKGPSWDEAKDFARTYSEAMAKAAPDRFTTNIRKTARTGKIFIDYLRNGEGASSVAAYSTRARKGAPTALPIDWKELKTLKGGDDLHMKDAVKRQKKDPWRAMTTAAIKQKLPKL